MLHRRAAAALLISAGLLGAGAACGSSDTGAPATTTTTSAATSSPAPSSAPGSAGAVPDTAVQACESVTSATAARQVVTTAGTKPVLRPAVALVLLETRQAATAGISAPAPVGPAFSELLAAVDDLDARLGSALPDGADPVQTPVTVDPSRLGAALDRVEQACAGVG